MTVRPVRLQLSRKKGFDLQALSRATNGLHAVSVARPSLWGNPFYIINEEGFPLVTDARDASVPVLNDECADLLNLANEALSVKDLNWEQAREGLVALFRQRCVDALPRLDLLRGKNLACWCRPDEPCHADVLLVIANR